MERIIKNTPKGLIFFSDQNSHYQADMVIDLSANVKDRSGAVFANNWQRTWFINILARPLYNQKMGDMLDHLKSIRARQLYKKSFDI